jgi:hypothetical protein
VWESRTPPGFPKPFFVDSKEGFLFFGQERGEGKNLYYGGAIAVK